VLRSPELDPALKACLTSAEQRERTISLDLHVMSFLMQLLAVGFPCCEGSLLAHGQLLHQDLFCKDAVQLINGYSVLVRGVIHPRCRALHLPLYRFMTLPVARSSSLLSSSASHPPLWGWAHDEHTAEQEGLKWKQGGHTVNARCGIVESHLPNPRGYPG